MRIEFSSWERKIRKIPDELYLNARYMVKHFMLFTFKYTFDKNLHTKQCDNQSSSLTNCALTINWPWSVHYSLMRARIHTHLKKGWLMFKNDEEFFLNCHYNIVPSNEVKRSTFSKTLQPLWLTWSALHIFSPASQSDISKTRAPDFLLHQIVCAQHKCTFHCSSRSNKYFKVNHFYFHQLHVHFLSYFMKWNQTIG